MIFVVSYIFLILLWFLSYSRFFIISVNSSRLFLLDVQICAKGCSLLFLGGSFCFNGIFFC